MKKYNQITPKEMSDSGQALVLILLIVGMIFGGRYWFWAAIAALVVNMACPRIYRGFACLWLNFSHVLGIIVSHVIMACQFFLLVLPIGLVRRLMGKDAMAFKKWRGGSESVFVERNHTYVADDLRNPY